MEEAEKLTLHRYCVIPQSVQKKISQHPLCKNLFLTEIGFEGDTAFLPFKKHTAGNHYLLIYVAKGEGWYSVRDKTFSVTENDFFVLSHEFAMRMGSSGEIRVPSLNYAMSETGNLHEILSWGYKKKTTRATSCYLSNGLPKLRYHFFGN